MNKPNIWISWTMGFVFSLVSIGAYIGSAFITGLGGFIIRLVVLALIFGTVVGSVFHTIRKLKWIEEQDTEDKE